MPRKVDHDERRMLVAKVVEDLVHEIGIEALTIRDVARRAGCSTSIVSHYFSNKLEMLLFTHQMVRGRAEQRLLESYERGDDLITSLALVMPIDDEGRRDWHTWFSLWGMAPDDPDIDREWHQGVVNAANIFARIFIQAAKTGEIAESVDVDADVARLQILINGISSLVLQDEAAWPAVRQLETLRSLLVPVFGYRQK